MINYLKTRPQRDRKLKLFGLLIIIFIAAGVYFVISPLSPVLSDEAAKYDINILPDNLPPEDYVATDLHLPTNQIVNRTPEKTTDNKVAIASPELPNNPNPEVLGISYNEEALKSLQPTKQTNRIVIPKMGVDNVILEGATADTLWKGIWRMPVSSTPDQGGNTVITAHRYLYKPPNTKTFYNIDKLVAGDIITIFWEGEKYEYRVSETKIVEPSEVSILNNTSNAQLTIFSCTPLFTSKQRLVVIADLI